MRIKLIIIAVTTSLALVSGSLAGVHLTRFATDSSIETVAAKKLKPNMSMGKFKAAGGTARSTHPSGCTYGAVVTTCNKICIQTASGDTCVAHNSCYKTSSGIEIPC